MKHRAIFVGGLLLGSSFVLGQGDPATIQKVIAEGKDRNQVMNHLKHLTKKIGHRLTGSKSLQEACDWTASMFKKFGLQNVHLEQWGEVPVGFQRGKNSFGRMVSPFRAEFAFTSPSWTPGTNGPLRGRAVLEPENMEQFNQVKDQLRGAWMLSKRQPPRRPTGGAAGTPPPEPTELEKAIADSGYAGRVTGSRNELTITSGRFQDLKWEDLPKERRVQIRKSDFDRVTSNIERGQEVVLEFNLDQKFYPGPVPIYNVIADIPGTEKPDEMVIVSGHLDSWDGPGSEGALDNGTGTMVALEAARLLMHAGAKPKRTIRFILWTGEEQGLFGSRRYVEMHKDEMDKVSAVFVDDGGTNYQGGMALLATMEPMLRQARFEIRNLYPDLPFEFRVVERMPRGGGSDHASFNAVGVPGFFWDEVGRSDYNYVHHTQHDKYEFAIPEYLMQSSVNSAVMAFNVACAPTMLPRGPKPDPNAPAGGGRPGGGGGGNRGGGGGGGG